MLFSPSPLPSSSIHGVVLVRPVAAYHRTTSSITGCQGLLNSRSEVEQWISPIVESSSFCTHWIHHAGTTWLLP
ncbi:unnamed protein product [Victoria cruziana]